MNIKVSIPIRRLHYAIIYNDTKDVKKIYSEFENFRFFYMNYLFLL